MDFFTRVLSGNSRLNERAREAEQVNQAFKENLDNLKVLLESEESDDVLALLDMVYDSSFPEEQIFMKTPSRARLKSKKELNVRLLIGLDSLGVPGMAEMLVFIKKHGTEGIADSLMTLLEFLSPLLEGKEAPEFSTDDVVDAMDFEWHSASRTGSPLLNVIASATSSPRNSTASIGDSPLHPTLTAYRRALSDRSMLVQRAHELGAKTVLDKTSMASTPPQRSLTMSASSQYPSANQDFHSDELTILETPASPEITQVYTDETPSSYSLDTFPEAGLQRRHRRKSSSLRQLFDEDTIEELSGEGSVGTSSKRNSSSSSWRRNSSDITKIITSTSETSSPMNSGLAAGDSRGGGTMVPDKEFLSSIYTQDRQVNRSSRKGSRRILPSPLPDEVAIWREDSGGFSMDLITSDKNAAQTSVFPPIQLESSCDIPETEGRNADIGVESSPLVFEDLIKSNKSNILDQDNILPGDLSPLSNKDFVEPLITMSQTPQYQKSDFASIMPGDELSEAEEHTDKVISEEGPSDCSDVRGGKFGNSTGEPLDTDGSYPSQNRIEVSWQDANEYWVDGKLEATSLAKTIGGLLTTQQEYSEDEFNESEDVDAHSVSDNKHEKVEHIIGASSHYSISDNDDVMNVGHESNTVEDIVNVYSSSDNDHMSVEHVHGFGARSHENSYSSSEPDEHDRSSSQISIASKSITSAQEHTVDCNCLTKDQLNKFNAFETALDHFLQTKQSNVFQHGHQRSHSDVTHVIRSLFTVESLNQEKLNLRCGSESDIHVKTDKQRRKFARRLGSLTSSMESLRSREGSADRVVMQESKPWMPHMNLRHREEASEEHEESSDVSSDEGTSSDSSSVDDAEHGTALILHDLEAEGCPSGVDDDALKPHEHEFRLQSHIRDGDVEEDARHAHPSHDHEKDARHTYSLDTCDEDAGHMHMIALEQDGCKTAPNNITPEDSSQEGYGFQWILAPLLLPSSSNVPQDVNDKAGDISFSPLVKDKDLNSKGGSSDDEREDTELHAALSPCEDLQTTQEEGDVKRACPMQDQGQVNIQYGCHRDVSVQSCATDITDDSSLSFTHGVHGMINDEDRGSMFSNEAATLSHADVIASPTNGATVRDRNELLDDQHPCHHVKTDEHPQKLPSWDASLNMRSTALTDYADSNSTLQAPLFLESSPTLDDEPCLEENLQSKNSQSLKQEALEMKDDPSPGEEVNAHKSSLDEGVNSSLDTDSAKHSLNESINLELPELMREDEKKKNVQPLDLQYVGNVSRPCELEEDLNVSDDEFEKLLSELDDAKEVVLHEGGELPLINDIEGGQMEMHDDKEGKTRNEDSARRLDKEKMQMHVEKTGIVDENTLSTENSEKEFLNNTGQFIMGGPRQIPALVEFDDCNNMQDHYQAHQENPNLQAVEPSCEQGMQEIKGVHDVVSDTTGAGESTPFMDVYPVESHVVASTKQYGGSQEASRLKNPILVEAALQEGEVSKPCWEASDQVVDVSGSHCFHDKYHIRRSPAQISDAGSAAPSTKQGDTDQLAVQFTGSGTQCALSTKVADASECRPSHDVDDYIQQPAAQFTEPYAGSFAAVYNGDHTHAAFMASLKDHEHQNADHLSHVYPLSNKTEPPEAEYAHLHDHPTSSSTLSHVDSQPQSDQHVINQPATYRDPRWKNVPRSKGKGSCMGKLARVCISCCTKPNTNP